MENKKILYFITKSSWGGAQRYVYDLASYFAKENEVVVAFGENEFGGENIFEKKLKQEKVKTITIESLGRDISFVNDIKALFEIARIIKKEKPDIVHLNSSKTGLLGGVAARASRARRIIYTAHGLPFLEERSIWQNMIIKFLTWITFLLSHKVIAISDYEKSLVENWFFCKNKIKRIYNGIKEPEFLSREQARVELTQKYNIPMNENTFVAGSIAELTSNKGLIEFLPKLLEMKQEKEKQGKQFIYIHFGTGELNKKLKEKTKALSLQKNVFWLGFVAGASRYLKALDLFTLPSKKEGLPYVLLEAKFAEIDIMTSELDGMKEVLQQNKNKFNIGSMISQTTKFYDIY